ncbi:MAG: alpha/beta fold hydrolase, partial [Myxococcota bacterium]
MARLPAPALEHEAAGRYIEIAGQRVFVRSEGTGPPVLLLHGVPASSFLYRKMIPLLAKRGLQAVSFDLPGLGLSDKPAGAPYDWHTLSGWIDGACDALALSPVHLVVHDICGPIGCEWAIRHPEKVKSITIMNTLLDVAVFSPPFPMWLYRVPVVRQIMMLTQNAVVFTPLMRRV